LGSSVIADDGDVVPRAKQGDGAAWRTLYRAHAGRLLVFLSARPSGDAAITAEDLAAEAWLLAAQKIHSFNGSSEEFAGWLFGIARHLSMNAHRRSLRRGTVPTARPPETAFDIGPEPALMARDRVNALLAALPDRERDVVACIDVVGLDVASTARALDISAVAVRVAHHRAVRRLRQQVIGSPTSAASAAQAVPAAASSLSR
jgi:RNA polymerase sigma-70 factor, ECF subfamily